MEKYKNLKQNIQVLQSLMVAYVTGERTSQQPIQYGLLFNELHLDLEKEGYPNPNPHKSLEVFWAFCKMDDENFGTYAQRRAYVKEIYADLILDLDRKIKNIKDPKNWDKANKILEDKYEPVRRQWLKAKNYNYSNPPDFENSIKESINSIESVLKIIHKDSNSTLGKLLPKTKIDPDIKRIISHLYGVMSNRDFIRHGGVEDPNLDLETSEFILELAGTAIQYLIKIDQREKRIH